MQKRFPAAGESHIHNALRVSRLGDREKRGEAADDMPRFWVAVLGYHSTAAGVNDFRQLQLGSSAGSSPDELSRLPAAAEWGGYYRDAISRSHSEACPGVQL